MILIKAEMGHVGAIQTCSGLHSTGVGPRQPTGRENVNNYKEDPN
jgi:hypothetical protein